MTANVAHRVDRIGSANHFAARRFDATITRVWLGLSVVTPIETLEAPNASDTKWNPDQGMPVPAACFEQQQADGRVGAEPAGQYATGGAGADDDIVEFAGDRHCHVTHLSSDGL